MPDQPTPDLSVIIVSWNVCDLLRECLASLTKDRRPTTEDALRSFFVLRPSSIEVIVIDNASADGSAEMVAREFPGVRLIANRDNRGFTGGNNQGIAAATGRYVFFLNPDTVIVGDALAVMAGYLETHDDVGVVGPQLRYGDGSLQSSRRRFPTLGSALFESTPLEWHCPGNRWARWYRMEDRREDAAATVQDVDWLVGAALMTRRFVLEHVGGFDEGYFMYSEELDWCRRVKAAGWRVVYLLEAQVIHYEGRSSEQVVATRHIRFQTSKVRYFRKFHGRMAAGALRVFLLAAFGVEWGLEAGKWLLGSKRPLRRSRLTAYGQLLRSGLRPR